MIKKSHTGFTLVELVIFIVVIATTLTILIGLAFTLRHANRTSKQAQAIVLAQQRMEAIINQRHKLGFTNFISGNNYDPCKLSTPPTSICTIPANFTITTSLATTAICTNCRTVTVTVSGKGNATLKTLIADYPDEN